MPVIPKIFPVLDVSGDDRPLKDKIKKYQKLNIE